MADRGMMIDGDIWPIADRYVRSSVQAMGDTVDEKLIQGAINKVALVLQNLRWAQRGEFKPGDVLRVQSATGIIERTVAGYSGSMLLICRPEEYALAKEQGREPISIGWRRADVIGRAETPTR